MQLHRAQTRTAARRGYNGLKSDIEPRAAANVQVYDIDEYEDLLSKAQDHTVASQLEITPGGLLKNLTVGANRVLDEIADLASGPFPTTNNGAKMQPFLASMQQQTAGIQNPQMALTPTMAAPGMPMQMTPQMPMAMTQPMQPQLTPNVPVMAPMPTLAQTAAMAGPVPQMVIPGAPQQNIEQNAAQNVNDALKAAYVSPSMTKASPSVVSHEHLTGIIVVVMLVVFVVAGCIVRLKQRKKSKNKV
ncbi:uncharacterized protein BXIN_1499 [Babesia sp. Xinjiang]|uniref:uncharacterized protein n=1 Tax=Babesia sp. Xinjiang TaxID=462227 RepID=UPI000A240001|nr:uncharacterized protein BXIN_1499 [Babesia sp. Xinjiang]ORM42250.1 hypothetical protein BXIN_1499 [Babesia sp. Xinjiang]